MHNELLGKRVLIVDDTKINITILLDALKSDYKLSIAVNGVKALEYLENNLPDLILLDIMMPEMDGYEVCARIKRDPRTRDIPVIFITAMHEIRSKSKGFELGAVDYITKPFEIPEVRARVKTHLALKHAGELLKESNRTLEEKVRERTRELRHTQLEIVTRLGRAAEYRDNETGAHIKRMSRYCELLGKAAGLSDDESEMILHASPMHDIGKIGIPDRVLLKPARLNGEEWKIMKTHTVMGSEILSGNSSKLLGMARTIAVSHHEKWDGSGYPNGLAGEAIPLEGRLCALCDVFDALTSKRPYKEAWSVEQALEEIKNNAGSHFDSRLVDCFLGILPGILVIRSQFPDTDEHHGHDFQDLLVS